MTNQKENPQEENPKKRGAKKCIATPEELMNHFEDYASETKEKPFKVHDFVGKDGEEVYRKKERPLTMVGFENYCFRKGVIYDLKDYFANSNGGYEEYQPACRTIKSIIQQDQIEGGMAGIYNHTLTARLNGLVDKTQNENHNINRVINVQVMDSNSPLSSNEKDVSLD